MMLQALLVSLLAFASAAYLSEEDGLLLVQTWNSRESVSAHHRSVKEQRLAHQQTDSKGSATNSCQKQWDCFTWTITANVDVDDAEENGCRNDDCLFQVCWKYSNEESCVKKGGTLSHTCEKAAGCPPAVGDWVGAVEREEVPVNYTQCQIGGALDTLEFVVKDGNGCNDTSWQDQSKLLYPDDCSQPASVTCSNTSEKTCTGQGNVGKECLWTVELPDVSTCCIWGDPHVLVFDGKQVSLRSEGINAAVQTEANALQALGAGDMWLIKSALVSIQVRYLPDDDLPTGRLFVRALALGGSFLRNNTMIIRPLGEQVSWNGNEILTSELSEFKVQGLLRAKQHMNSSLVTDMTKSGPGIDLKLPMGVRLTVNRLKRFINVQVKMPALEGGQDGLCGNYNGDASDDALDELVRHRELKVDPQDSLFSDKN